MDGDDAAAPPRDVVAAVMKEGVKALMALPSGTVVCFVDANGPLATVRDGGNAKAPRWVLRPYVDLSAARSAGARPVAHSPRCAGCTRQRAAFAARWELIWPSLHVCAGGVTSAQLPALPAESLFTIHRTGDRVTFRSLGCVPAAMSDGIANEH